VETLTHAIAAAENEVVLVGHSTGSLLVAFWAAYAAREEPVLLSRVRGALLVAPSDPDGPVYPPGPEGFTPVPRTRIPFPSIVVASTNDEYVTIACARSFAESWGSRFVNIGELGHINGASGLGSWPEGWALLNELKHHVTH
jgi:predicted alpha/beta hydrolase family esterase